MNAKNIFKLLWAAFILSTLYWIVRFWGHFPAFMDTLEYVFPEKWFNVESYQNGRIPLWNPYLACGTPHVASLQPAAFYPIFWLWNFTGLSDWFFVLGLLHGILAAVGFYLWLRSLNVSPIPATLCGLSFGGSALMVNYWGFPTHLASVAWVPWVFWGTVELTRKPSFYRWSLSVLFWSLQILAGYPFFTFYSALFLGFWMWARNTRELKIHFIHGSAFLAALAVTACQWLPFVDFMGYLHRDGWGENLFSLRWVNYLTLLQPDLLGIPGTTDYKGDYPNFIFNNIYLGVVPSLFLIWSFFLPVSRENFWKGAALFWFFWLAGINFWPWRILPASLLDKMEPSKASFLFLFCAFTALGVSLQEKINATSKKNKIWKWAGVLVALWMVDLLGIPGRLIHVVSDPYRNQAVKDAALKAKQMAGGERIVSLRDPNQYYSQDVQGLDGSFMETALDLIPNTNVIWGLRSARGYLTIFTDGYQNIHHYLRQGYPYDGRVLDAAGVGLILFPKVLPPFKYQSFEPVGRTIFTKNAGAMPNAWQTSRVHEFVDRPAVFDALLDPKSFLEDEVYTEKGPGGKAVCLAPSRRVISGAGPGLGDRFGGFLTSFLGNPTAIQGLRPSPCEAQFQVQTSHPGFMVFDESFSPGWHAWVDGEPKAIFRSYGLWMSLSLPDSGAHQVLFRYEPTSFRLGLFITLLSLAAWGMVLCRRRAFCR